MINAKYNPSSASWQTNINQTQISLISRSFLYAAISFAAIALSAFGLSAIWNYVLHIGSSSHSSAVFSGVLFGSLILMITSSFMQFAWIRKGPEASTRYALLVYGVFGIAQGFAFSLFFCILGIFMLSAIFVVAAIFFAIAFMIAKILSEQATISLSKFVSKMSLALVCIFILNLIITPILMVTHLTMFSWWYSLIYCLFAVLIFASTIIELRSIMATSQYFSENSQETEVVNKVALFCGFRILSSFISIIWTLIMLLSMFTR